MEPGMAARRAGQVSCLPAASPGFLISGPMPAPDLSLIVPVRDEEGNIGPLATEIRSRLDAAGLTWELLFVDDGSTDGSWAEIVAAAADDERIQGVRHDSGQGKSAALMTGFARSRGRAVAMLDGDGQDDPAEIPKMLPLLSAGSGGVALVNGWKTPRLDPWHKTLPSAVFNRLVGWVTGLRLHDHNCGLKVLHGETARSLVLDHDMHRFIPTLVALAGGRVIEKPVHHRPRLRGRSKYGAARFVRGLADLGRIAARLADQPGRERESRGHLRRSVFWILAAVAIGGILGRIGSVSSVDRLALEKRLAAEHVDRVLATDPAADPEQARTGFLERRRLMRPFLSANDRSRWATVRSLVERGTFAIEEIVVEPEWGTIDTVVHPDRDGVLHLYSSKPPLLAVLSAGPYWLLTKATGWTLGDHPFELGRGLLVVVSLLPFAVFLLFSLRLVEAVGGSDWGRLWTAAVLAFGTLLSTFAVVLNNHLPAAAATAAAAWACYRITCQGSRRWLDFAAAGFAGALAAAFELPALAWLAAVLLLLARVDLRRTLLAAGVGASLVAAAAIGTNWLAHGTVAPAYAFRNEAEPRPTAPVAESGGPAAGRPGQVVGEWNPQNWYDYSVILPNGRLLASYWRSPQGIDRGEPSPLTYAWHVLVGHHGIFSLTPAWLLVIPGLALLACRTRQGGGEARLAAAIGAVSLIVIAFYLSRPMQDRNYGGMTSGFRWAFWLAPLWATAATPAADLISRSRAGRGIGLVLLGLSVVSVAFPTWNPWTLPWIQQWLEHAGVLR
jgi:glycosyltransferase involved in cell wall biosynthesis